MSPCWRYGLVLISLRTTSTAPPTAERFLQPRCGQLPHDVRQGLVLFAQRLGVVFQERGGALGLAVKIEL